VAASHGWMGIAAERMWSYWSSTPLYGVVELGWINSISSSRVVVASPCRATALPAASRPRLSDLSVESENRRAQFLPDLQPNSRAIGQKDGEIWAAAVDLQPTTSSPDSLRHE
jgi:hypothetical protein